MRATMQHEKWSTGEIHSSNESQQLNDDVDVCGYGVASWRAAL